MLLFLLPLHLKSVRSDYEKIKKERENFLKSKDLLEKNLKQSNQSSTSEIEQLRSELNEANQKLIVSQNKIDGKYFMNKIY